MYPKLEELAHATQEQLAVWYRFLPSPKTEEEVIIMKMICNMFKGFDSKLSKKIGWE